MDSLEQKNLSVCAIFDIKKLKYLVDLLVFNGNVMRRAAIIRKKEMAANG